VPGICFSIKDVLVELEAAKGLAGEFVENREVVFPQLRTQLEGLRDERASHLSWKIPAAQPLRTIVSEGEYDRGGGRDVIGTLSFLWEVQRVKQRRKNAPAQFQLVGVASTVSRVFVVNEDGSQGEELAMWRMEIGDDNSPGCHFHVQLNREDDIRPFPSSLPVPRLPSCLATPMAVLEFMLAELFQERWRKHVFSETDSLKRWRAIQRTRFLKLLAWQREAVSAADRSPWSVLKSAKPPQEIFLE
jgi:hypothetical protein